DRRRRIFASGHAQPVVQRHQVHPQSGGCRDRDRQLRGGRPGGGVHPRQRCGLRHGIRGQTVRRIPAQLANEVIVLRDGVEALDYLFRRNQYQDRVAGNPAVLLLDLKLPRLDGLEVLKAIRESDELRSIPVVMLT
nr:hypothetical protein [Tanacetum cinerariifolium]